MNRHPVRGGGRDLVFVSCRDLYTVRKRLKKEKVVFGFIRGKGP